MQALIDFDGWRKWKDFAAQSDSSKDESKKAAGAKKKKDTATKDGIAKDKVAGLKKDTVDGGVKITDTAKDDSQTSITSNA
jgi:osomolarity two-component system, response regulator SSK1